MLTSRNPEELTFNSTKSFLKPRESARETGSKFFSDNKIRSCSFVKQTSKGFQAVPFYDRRNQTIYPTPSTVTRSWSSQVHNNRGVVHAGMGSSKPLSVYSPTQERSLMRVENFRPPYPNSSQIEIGNRSEKDPKHYTTTYANNFFGGKRELPTLHVGIKASRNQWIHSRMQK